MNEKISNGGESARKSNSRCKNEERKLWRDDFALVYVIYWDHILFKKMRPEEVQPCIREAVGWLHHQDTFFIVLLMDRAINPQSLEKIDLTDGLFILRSSIIKITELSLLVPDKLTSSKG